MNLLLVFLFVCFLACALYILQSAYILCNWRLIWISDRIGYVYVQTHETSSCLEPSCRVHLCIYISSIELISEQHADHFRCSFFFTIWDQLHEALSSITPLSSNRSSKQENRKFSKIETYFSVFYSHWIMELQTKILTLFTLHFIYNLQ